MKRCLMVLASVAVVSMASISHAQNLLVNGNLEATPANTYFDGFDPTVADDVPGWNLFLGGTDGSYVYVNGVGGANVDVDMGNGPAGGGLETAAASRPAVIPGALYAASVTFDNYFTATTTSYFIDWFDGVGSLISSDGGPVADLNGPFGYDPYGQLASVSATAPLTAASAGVRFISGAPSYAGLAADNFSLRQVPEPSTVGLLLLSGMSLLTLRGSRHQS